MSRLHYFTAVCLAADMRSDALRQDRTRRAGHSICAFGCLTVAVLWFAGSATAGPYVTQGPFDLLGTGSGPPAPPDRVPGKAYSDHFDVGGHDAGHGADPEQSIAWDGAGGTADSVIDYSGSRAGLGDLTDREVDAAAADGDAFFFDVIANSTPLVFSTDADASIYFERTGGAGGVWASPAAIESDGVVDLDALEVWGADGPAFDDSNLYSLEFDPVVDPVSGRRIAVFTFFGGVSAPHLFSDTLASIIGHPEFEDTIDLDAMMFFGDFVFSIDPIGPFDGGEIWVWDGVSAAATFLSHGGHLWDTAFPVAATFGTASENINALEAVSVVPEPSTFTLAGLGFVGLIAFGRRQHGKADPSIT